MSNFQNKNVLLGVGGGIAAYKACELLRRLTDSGAQVHVVLTKAAQKFITALTFQSLSQHPVHTDLFNLTEESEMSHIQLADQADVVLVAPVTADLLAKIACGLADDLLTTSLLVTQAPVVLAPSMNVNMWEKEVVQFNLNTLKSRGYHIVEPEAGYLACGWEGKGRLAEIENILGAAHDIVTAQVGGKKKSLAGRRFLITAGPTREFIDPVRFLSNPSTGKMGFALAAEAALRGATVTLVSGPVALPPPSGVKYHGVTSAEEMLKICQLEFPQSECFIATAAVGDYRSENIQKQKGKKTEGPLALNLVRTPDILFELGQKKQTGQIVVGFAAETEQLLKNAKEKITKKHLDLIVANDVSRSGNGFASNDNQVTILSPSGQKTALPSMPKTQLAGILLNEIEKLMNGVGN